MKEAALRMGVTETTAREYWARVKEKWNVRTVGHAAAIWPDLDTPARSRTAARRTWTRCTTLSPCSAVFHA